MNKRVSLEEVRRRKHFDAPNPGYITPGIHGVVDPITLDGKPIPERRWLVDDWVPAGTVTMLAGDGGVGKSLLAQQLLTCAAVGKDWLGQRTMPCRAIGLFCEDDGDELHRRQDAINRHLDIGFADLENLQWVSRVGEENSLMTFEGWEAPGQPTELFQQIHNLTQDFGAELIVLDSLHDLFPGNENSRPHARRFIQVLASLARDMGDKDGTVVLTAHPSLSGLNTGSGMSGSTAWNNAVRSRFYLTRPKEDEGETGNQDERVLQRKKANYAGINDQINLLWSDGAFIAKEVATGIFGTIERRKVEDVFLNCLDATAAQGRYVTDARNSPRYAPAVFASIPEGGRIRKREFERAMNALFSDGKIRVEEVKGTDRHWQKVIARTGNEGAGSAEGALVSD